MMFTTLRFEKEIRFFEKKTCIYTFFRLKTLRFRIKKITWF